LFSVLRTQNYDDAAARVAYAAGAPLFLSSGEDMSVILENFLIAKIGSEVGMGNNIQIIEEFANEFHRVQIEWDEFLKKARDDTNELFVDNKGQLEIFRKMTEEKIRLQSARSWSERAEQLAGSAKKPWWIFYALGGTAVAGGIGLGPKFIETLSSSLATAGLSGQSPALVTVAFLAVIAAVLFLLLNATRRMAMDLDAAAADAARRQMTIDTFLALIGDETTHLKPEDRSLMLGAVFAPPSNSEPSQGEAYTALQAAIAQLRDIAKGK